jgi:hypothetical protein
MNEKIKKLVKDQGYCCLWAFFQANRAAHTSALMKLARDAGFNFSTRALQQQRARFRSKEYSCERATPCLRQKIQDGHTIVLHPRKAS